MLIKKTGRRVATLTITLSLVAAMASLTACGGGSAGSGHEPVDNSPHIDVSTTSHTLAIPDSYSKSKPLKSTLADDVTSNAILTFTKSKIKISDDIIITTTEDNPYLNGVHTCEIKPGDTSCSLTLSAKHDDVDQSSETISFKATNMTEGGRSYPVSPDHESYEVVKSQPGPTPSKTYSITINDGNITGVTSYPVVSSICGQSQDFSFSNWGESHTFTFKADPSTSTCPVNINEPGYIVSPSDISLSDKSIILSYEEYVVNDKGKITFHVMFPFNKDQKQPAPDHINLSDPIIHMAVVSNIFAGVMYAHLIHEKYSTVRYDDGYLYGTMFGQLLQEGGLEKRVIAASFNPSDPDQFMHNKAQRKALGGVGQGGPYQINDYAKRLPSYGAKEIEYGALGLTNYNTLHKVLGYSIADQDQLVQIKKVTPTTFDNIYVGPIITAFYHLNDITRQQVHATLEDGAHQAGNYRYFAQWRKCYTNMQVSKYNYFTNIVMNVVYNAGDFSDWLKPYLDVCGSPDAHTNAVVNINNYGLSWKDYQKDMGITSPATGGSTYMRYPRQVNFYLDQLYNDNASLIKNNGRIQSNNTVRFNVTTDMEHVFTYAMDQLSYRNGGDDTHPKLVTITKDMATNAFKDAMQSMGIEDNTTLNLSDDSAGKNDRKKIFNLFDLALTNLEKSIGTIVSNNKFQFATDTTKYGPPPPLPTFTSNNLYSKSCGGEFTSDVAKASTFALVPEENDVSTCKVYHCAQPGWCKASCTNAYSLPYSANKYKAGTAWDSAWKGDKRTVSCPDSR